LDNKIFWFTQSKASSKAKEIPPTLLLLFQASKISFTKLYEAISIEEFYQQQTVH
jgi:hypothetical protein